MEELLVLIDENDDVKGYEEKMKVHIQGKLHRAFSLFLFSKITKRLLIQRRSIEKYHSGGLWTNSCCSHPRMGENIIDSIKRRVLEELGIVIEWSQTCLSEVGKFQYFVEFENCSENEIDHVFVCELMNEPEVLCPNPDEICEYKWITTKDLKRWISREPGLFTAWFSEALSLVENSEFGASYFH